MALTRLGPNQSVNLASNVTGTLPTGNGGTGTTSFSPGKVLQVQSTLLNAEFSSSSTSFTDVTNLSLTITPAATSSKILLLCNTNTHQNTDQSYWAMRWERAISGGATTNIGHGTYGLSFARSAQAHDFWGGVGMTYLDSPSTTSEITYQVQASSTGAGSFTIGVNSSSTNSIMALEIAG
jgi:hypothetical protein